MREKSGDPRICALFIILAISGLSFGQSGLHPSAVVPKTDILALLDPFTQIAIGLMILMIVLAALAYIIGPVFGSETSARLRVWANNMLGAVGVSVAILLVLRFILPGYQTGQEPTLSLEAIIQFLAEGIRDALFAMIFLLLIVAVIVYLLGQTLGAEGRARAVTWANMSIAAAMVAAVVYVIFFEILGQFRATYFFETLGLQPFLTPLVYVLSFVGIFILLTYIVSKFFRIPEWEAYLNVEMSNLIGSFILVVFILGMFAFGTIVAKTYDPLARSPPDAVIRFMRETVADNVLRGMYDVYTIQACTSVLNTLSKRIGEAVLTQTFKVFPGIDTFVSITNVLGYGIVTVYGSLNAQMSMLYLVDIFVVNFILPAGLILRFIPSTRDAGAFLIALAFGMQVVFPMSYLINKQVMDSLQLSGYHSNQFLIAGLCGPFKYGFWGYMLNPAGSTPLRYIPGSSVVLPTLSKLISDGYLNAISMDEFIYIMDDVASLSLLALFMPALSTVIMIASINVMTKFILMKT